MIVLYIINCIILTLNILCVASDDASKLALASILVQFGGADFDFMTNTMTISRLVKGLNPTAVISYIRFLADIIKHSVGQSTDSAHRQKKDVDVEMGGVGGRDGLEEMEETNDTEGEYTVGLAAIEALSTLCRNNNIAGHRSAIVTMILSLFLRISCFSTGSCADLARKLMIEKTNDNDDSLSAITEPDTKKRKKPKKEKKVKHVIEVDPMINEALELTPIVKDLFNTILLVDNSTEYPPTIIEAAKYKLLSALSDFGSSSLVELDAPKKPRQNHNEKNGNDSDAKVLNDSKGGTLKGTVSDNENPPGPLVMDVMLTMVGLLRHSGLKFCRDENNSMMNGNSSPEVTENEEGSNAADDVYHVIQKERKDIQQLIINDVIEFQKKAKKDHSSAPNTNVATNTNTISKESKSTAQIRRFYQNYSLFLGHSYFLSLCNDDIDIEASRLT